MRWRTGGGLLVVLGLIAALVVVGRSFGSSDPCIDPPVLAAGMAPAFADSCIEMVSYKGTTYYVDCVKLHPSRVGAEFFRDGGETQFDGATAIEGIGRADAFILDGDYCPKNTTVAVSDSFTRLQAGLLKVPVTATNPLQQARARQPWIVPGRREIPEMLDLDAVLDETVIAITNRNQFAWRSCNQLQINAPDDEWAPWEARPVESGRPGERVDYPVEEFGRDSGRLEQLSEDGAEDLRASEVIVMCRAPGGPAMGSTRLR